MHAAAKTALVLSFLTLPGCSDGGVSGRFDLEAAQRAAGAAADLHDAAAAAAAAVGLDLAFAAPALDAAIGQDGHILEAGLGTTQAWSESGFAPIARSGAPDDGMRVVLYELDAYGRPVSPLVESGWVDFRDVGTTTAPLFTVRVVLGGDVVADFYGVRTSTATYAGSTVEQAITVDSHGSMTGAAGKVSFALDSREHFGVPPYELDQDVRVRLGRLELHRVAGLTLEGARPGSITTTFTDHGAVTMIQAAGDNSGWSATVRYNGTRALDLAWTAAETMTCTMPDGTAADPDMCAAVTDLLASTAATAEKALDRFVVPVFIGVE